MDQRSEPIDVVALEVYDNHALSLEENVIWPTKLIMIERSWLDAYARLATRYRDVDDLMHNYTLEEVDGLENFAQISHALVKITDPAMRINKIEGCIRS